MVFTVDEEKKRTWNHGWWKRWFQGRVLLTLFLIGILSFVLMLPRYIKDTMIWWENIRALIENKEFEI